jgi:hypothetical protein
MNVNLLLPKNCETLDLLAIFFNLIRRVVSLCCCTLSLSIHASVSETKFSGKDQTWNKTVSIWFKILKQDWWFFWKLDKKNSLQVDWHVDMRDKQKMYELLKLALSSVLSLKHFTCIPFLWNEHMIVMELKQNVWNSKLKFSKPKKGFWKDQGPEVFF